MRAFGSFIILTGALLAGPAVWAAEVSGPEGGVSTHSADVADDQYALPVRSFSAAEPTVTLTGRIIRRAWRVAADRPVSAIVADYRKALADGGYSVVLDCAGHACGGFDFRFGAELLPPPDMAMDVSEFQQLTVGRESPANYVSVLVSKVRDQIFVQIITAMPNDPGMALIAGDAESAESGAGQTAAAAKRNGTESIKADADKVAIADLAEGAGAGAEDKADPKAIDLAAGDVSKVRPDVDVETEPAVTVADNGELKSTGADNRKDGSDPETGAVVLKDTDPNKDLDKDAVDRAAKDAGKDADAAANTSGASSADPKADDGATETAVADGAERTTDAPESTKPDVTPSPEDGATEPTVAAGTPENAGDRASSALGEDGAVPDDVSTADATAEATYVGPKPRPDWILRGEDGMADGDPDATGPEVGSADDASTKATTSVKAEPEPDPIAGSSDATAGASGTGDTSLFALLTKFGHVTVDGLLFESGGAALSEASSAALDKMAGVMTENPKLRFAIVGHSDNVGPLDVNIEISRRRAEAVRRALIRRGISANRMVARGVGFLSPRRSNATEEGRAMNRRVELVLGEPVE